MSDTGIDFYTWSTPNGRKVSILLEELELDYRVHSIDITKDEQFDPEFLAISPNNKIPALVDHDSGISLMESGAILIYLAQKHGRFLSKSGPQYWEEIEWLMLQMGGIGPMLGQVHHFTKFNAGKAPYAEARYQKEARRLYGVLDRRLEQRDYLADEYSIADMATWPWISRFQWQQIDLDEFLHLKAWYLRIAQRPAVRRGYAVPLELDIPLP